MRARERASRPNHQPLPAHLHLSAGKESGSPEKYAHITAGETRFSISCERSRLPLRAVGPVMDCGDSGSPLTLSPRPARKQSVSNQLASGVSSLESRRLAAPNPAASVPLTVKPFEINGSSGSAAWRPFFVRKVKLTPLLRSFFTPSPETWHTADATRISMTARPRQRLSSRFSETHKSS